MEVIPQHTIQANGDEPMKRTLDELAEMIVKGGGSIVSSNDCSHVEIAVADACGRFYVRDDGMGFVYRLPSEEMSQ